MNTKSKKITEDHPALFRLVDTIFELWMHQDSHRNDSPIFAALVAEIGNESEYLDWPLYGVVGEVLNYAFAHKVHGVMAESFSGRLVSAIVSASME